MTAAADMAAWTDCAAIGAILRARRGARGLRAVAAEIGTSHSSLSRLERGRAVEVTTLQRVHDWLQANAPAGQGPPSPSAAPAPAPRLEPHPDFAALILAANRQFLTLDADGHQ